MSSLTNNVPHSCNSSWLVTTVANHVRQALHAVSASQEML